MGFPPFSWISHEHWDESDGVGRDFSPQFSGPGGVNSSSLFGRVGNRTMSSGSKIPISKDIISGFISGSNTPQELTIAESIIFVTWLLLIATLVVGPPSKDDREAMSQELRTLC